MAITLEVRNNTTRIGFVTIPDNSIPEIRRVVGGVTASETAQAFLDYITPIIRESFRRSISSTAFTDAQAASRAAQQTAEVTFDANWTA